MISLTLVVLLVATAMLDHVFAAGAGGLGDRTLGVSDELTMRAPDDIERLRPGYRFLDRYVRPMTKLP